MKTKLRLFLFLLTTILGASGYAQAEPSWAIRVPQTFVINTNSSNQDPKQQELETQEKILAELKKLREQVKGMEGQISAQEQTLQLYKEIDEARKMQVAVLKSIVEDTQKYDTLNQKKEELYKQEIALLNSEISRLNSSLSAEKRSKFFSKVGAALLTIGVAYAASR